MENSKREGIGVRGDGRGDDVIGMVSLETEKQRVRYMSEPQFQQSLDALLEDVSSSPPGSPSADSADAGAVALVVGQAMATEEDQILWSLPSPAPSSSPEPPAQVRPLTVATTTSAIPLHPGAPFASMPLQLSTSSATDGSLSGGAVSVVAGGVQHTGPSFPALNMAVPAAMLSMPPNNTASQNLFATGKRVEDETNSSRHQGFAMKRSREQASAISEDEGERDRRRHDRNFREQQRSQRISSQIENLRNILLASNVPSKPDKFSTLLSVEKYIKALQQRSALLDVEHRKLLGTISKTNELVMNQYTQVSAISQSSDTGGEASLAVSTDIFDRPPSPPESEKVFVNGIDYKTIFACCPFPWSIASVDGRFLDCNTGFEEVTGYSRAELIPAKEQKEVGPEAAATQNMSLFNILDRENIERLFAAMSDMLQNSSGRGGTGGHGERDTWCNVVHLNRRSNSKTTLRVTLVRSPGGLPRFFNCTLTPPE